MNRIKLLQLRGQKLLYAARRRELWAASKAGVFPSVDHARLLRRLQPATVVDVGAHSGQFALLVRTECPTARVISFEPQPAPGVLFRRLLGAHAELRAVALGDSPGEASMNVARASDSSSLLPIGAEQVGRFPGTDHVSTITVAVSTLNAEFGGAVPLVAPVLLKIDVQGFELAVLHGASTFLHQVEWVYVELSFVVLYLGQPLAAEIIRLLVASGFEISGVFNMSEGPSGEAVQADFLFARGHPGVVAA